MKHQKKREGGRSVCCQQLVFASILAVVFLAAVAHGQSAATMNIQANQPGVVVSSNLFGIFFEEINYGGDGGVYAEMVRNRSFASSASPDFWTLVTNGTAMGTMSVDTSLPLNTNNPSSLQLAMTSGSGSIGVANSGYWGIALQSGATCDLNFYARSAGGFFGPIAARLESADGSQLYARASFSGLTTNWQHFAAALVSSGSDTSARLVLSLTNNGTVWLDVVSLFPRATFHSRTNGLRLDLANKLADLHPSFLRYPGGNFIESFNVTNAVRWKKTIGDLAQRPGHNNDSWGYWSTDGYGLDEFFRQCEDMGMEPLYGINAGLMLNYNGSTNNTVPLDQMGPWVQDALDLIEYANGDTNTTWGAVRAANGHPAPYHLKYMEIGNENGGSYYNDRYTLFYDAITAKYPDIKLISPVWGTTPWSRPVEIRDEHYYDSPGTFIGYATKYDSYSRSGPKVFVGEYAVTSGYGTYGNLSAALGEAAFMTGMERNSDVVVLASYAPLFANVNGIQWHPDLIYYDNSRVFGTPSYYVQQMFGRNRGDVVLPVSVSAPAIVTNSSQHGAIGVGAWNTSVQYTNIIVTSNGVTLYQSDFANNGNTGWAVHNGTWSVSNGRYQQTSTTTTDCRSTTGDTNWANYTITLRARRTGGSEGFLILFNWTDDNNWTWWNVGGWGNTKDGIEQMVGGSKTLLAQVSQTAIATNTWYDISVVINGGRVQCYLNGALIQDYTFTSTSGLYASSTYNRASQQIITKIVNPYSAPLATTFSIAGVNSILTNATVVQLTSASALDENSLTAPTNVFPATNLIASAGTNFTLKLPAYSLSVLRLQTTGLNVYTNLLLQFASPITNGVTVASTVWGQIAGNWVNLTANTNHAITYASANTNVAVVDANGNVSGVGSGTTSITASYASLGLTAMQSVRVVYVPAALAHRYSFSETNGTNVADSVGGPAWNGWLPNGGTFINGQLILSSNSQQYVQLPAGILSNYTAVTIELWASFPSQLPAACFLFGFGNISGGTGYNYIFCQPRDGRIAITASDWSGEQYTPYPSGDWSGLTNLHVTAVFNPPQGYLALYTNGVLAAVNNSVTVPLSSVNDLYGFIGRSLYSGDSYFNLNLDEFRIYNGALSANEIAATQALGANQLLSNGQPSFNPPALASGQLTLSWPLNSADYTLTSCTNLAAGDWQPVTTSAAQIIGSNWQRSVSLSPGSRFFRLQK